MKRIKLLAILAAALMLLSACNIINVTEAASIGDTVVYKGEFAYYMQMGKSAAMKEAQAQGLTIETDDDWNNVKIGEKTAAQYAKDEAVKNLKSVMVAEAKAKKEGFTLDDAGKEEIKTTKESMISQMGGRYEYENVLNDMGISQTEFNTLIERSVYAGKYLSQFAENADEVKVSDDEAIAKYDADYVYVKHILISNQAPEDTTEEAVVEEAPLAEGTEAEENVPEAEAIDYDAEAKKEAEGILEKLASGADFEKLMNEHSDDSRDENGKLQSNGYIMTDNGQMVKEFEDAAMKLEIGAYTTELVQTSYGYHIIKRFENPKTGEDYTSTLEDIKKELANEKTEDLINAWAEEIGFVLNQKFIDRVKVKMEG
ncbi:MAG: peptidylprolyl isomerase [Clostridia bacterium]|nr:peptidylprolyl isomerase [Clostridia bacterium]